MNNFSDLLDINAKIKVTVTLRSICQAGVPDVWVKINDLYLFSDKLTSLITIDHELPLLSSIRLEIGMKNKVYNQHNETAVIIEQVSIDGFDIVPNWTHLARYLNEKNHDAPTHYLGFNGQWILSIDRPFYLWKHVVTGQGWLLDPI